jgi:hypothetical protein
MDHLTVLREWSSAHYDLLKDFAGPTVTLLGLVVTVFIAWLGFRSFDRWKREQLEDRRMEIAFQALKLAYECTFVFDHIRSAFIEPYEWAKMPQRPGDDESRRSTRGSFYAIMKRIEANKDFFKAVSEIQPACMAMFGVEIQDSFLELHKARRQIEVACQMLSEHMDEIPQIPDPQKALWQQLRADLNGAKPPFAPEGDRIGKRLTEFKQGIEDACLPVVRHRMKRKNPLRVPRRSF